MTVLPTKHLFGHNGTMMTRANSRRSGRRVAYSLCRSRSTDHLSTQAFPHTGITAPPLVPERDAELLVVDLIAQQNPQADAKLPRRSDPRFARPLLLQCSSIASSQCGVASHGVNGRLTPQIPQERIALLGELPKSLPIAARVFARNHPDVAGQCLRIDKSRGLPEEHFGSQRGHRAHPGMRHEATGLRACASLLSDVLIEFVNACRQVLVERLQFRSAMAGVWETR
jgi:hypothetical protein